MALSKEQKKLIYHAGLDVLRAIDLLDFVLEDVEETATKEEMDLYINLKWAKLSLSTNAEELAELNK